MSQHVLPAGAPDPAALTADRRQVRRLALVLGAAMATTPLAVDMYLPLLPTIRDSFAASAAATQLSLSAFFIGLAVGQVIYGPIADRIGRRGPLLFGMGVFILASLGCAVADTIETMVALRFVQAAGGCAGMVMARAVVRDLFDREGSAGMFSLLVLVMGMAPIVAPLIGGYLGTWLGWQAIFVVLAMVGLASLLAVLRFLPETLRPENRRPRGVSTVVRGYLVLLTDRRFLGYAFAGGISQAGMFAYISGSPFVFIELYGVPQTAYGWLFAINVIGFVAAAQANRLLLARYTSDTVLRAANAIVAAAGLAALAIGGTGLGGLAGLLPALFVYIAFLGINQPNAAAGALAGHARRAGAASALIGTIQFTAAALAGTLVGVMHDGTALPMVAVIALCGTSSFVIFRLMVRGRG